MLGTPPGVRLWCPIGRIRLRLTKPSGIAFFLVLFLLGFGIAAVMNGFAARGAASRVTDAADSQLGATDVEPSPHISIDASGNAIDSSDCMRGGAPDPNVTPGTSQTHPGGTTGGASKPSQPGAATPSAPSGSGGGSSTGGTGGTTGGGSSTGGGSDWKPDPNTPPGVKPPGHPGTNPSGDCPR